MYEMKIQVRYSEVNEEGYADIGQILEYFQDCGTFHSVSVGFGTRGGEHPENTWFLLAWKVDVSRSPRVCEYIRVITEPYKMHGYYGYRRFRIFDEEGEEIVTADSIWIYMDLEKMLPVKVPEAVKAAYVVSPADDAVTLKRKLSVKGGWEEKETLLVTRMYLDGNRHVNNTFYAIWAEDFLPEGETVREMRVDYRQSAFLGDTVKVYQDSLAENLRLKYVNQDDILLAIVEIDSQSGKGLDS